MWNYEINIKSINCFIGTSFPSYGDEFPGNKKYFNRGKIWFEWMTNLNGWWIWMNDELEWFKWNLNEIWMNDQRIFM